MKYPLTVTGLTSRLICHVQRPTPLYRLLGMKWYFKLTSPMSAIAIARSSYIAFRGSFSRALRSPNMITYIPPGANYKGCSTRWTAIASFGGTYAPKMYHLRGPNGSKNIPLFGPNLRMPSTCHSTSFLQTTSIDPQHLLSATVDQTV